MRDLDALAWVLVLVLMFGGMAGVFLYLNGNL